MFYKVSSRAMRISAVALSALWLIGCDNNSSSSSDSSTTPPTPPPETMVEFQVSIDNLTIGQPLSPIAVILHNDNYQVFAIGDSASAELEQLAESGSPTELLDSLTNNDDVLTTDSGAAPVGPGGSETFSLTVPESALGTLELSVVSMLVHTNDAIASISALPINTLASSETTIAYGLTYDAGTEANSEQAATIPGPDFGGEGFNAARDDIRDQVHVHPGAVTSQDGLASSALDGTHKWDHPAIRVQIERIN